MVLHEAHLAQLLSDTQAYKYAVHFWHVRRLSNHIFNSNLLPSSLFLKPFDAYQSLATLEGSSISDLW